MPNSSSGAAPGPDQDSQKPADGGVGEARPITPEMRAAVAWASGFSTPADASVERVCRSLSQKQVEVLLMAHKVHLAKASAAAETPTTPPKVSLHRRRNPQNPLRARAADAHAFIALCDECGVNPQGKWPYGHFQRFLKTLADGPLPLKEMCAVRAYIRRSVDLLHDQDYARSTPSSRSSARDDGHRRNKRNFERVRKVGSAGAPRKARIVRELLFEWFCSLRRSVSTRIPPSVLMVKATSLVEDYVVECIKLGIKPSPPKISHEWLRQWCIEYRVSLRKPNRKVSVPKHILLERLKIGWSNLVRVRALALRTQGVDPSLHNFDQSPYHMNEVGSKGGSTLALRGAPLVPLKEGHAATRSRWSANTMTSSSVAPAVAGRTPTAVALSAAVELAQVPPLEIMFKADADRLAARLQSQVRRGQPGSR